MATSKDEVAVEKSIFQWGVADEESNLYTLSRLGILNGILLLLPGNPVLVVEVYDETQKATGNIYFTKKWW